jgi:hypothetical protein
MFKKIFKKIPSSLYTVASLSALAAVNYSIINNSFVFIAILVLLCHELGHYFIAKKEGASPSLPIFFPLPFVAIAITRIKNLSLKSKKKVSISGPIFGFITALILFLLNIVFSYTSSIMLLSLMFGELVFNYIGTDGKKYRHAKKELSLCIS